MSSTAPVSSFASPPPNVPPQKNINAITRTPAAAARVHPPVTGSPASRIRSRPSEPIKYESALGIRRRRTSTKAAAIKAPIATTTITVCTPCSMPGVTPMQPVRDNPPGRSQPLHAALEIWQLDSSNLDTDLAEEVVDARAESLRAERDGERYKYDQQSVFG